ncbi:MAG: S8 family serine peptidase [Prevotella sp.]|nr:S8 family serine peptidase [Prevotella sp.]MBO5613695.1 S8 family serine peptidase [Prevotella sp.]
MNKFLHTLCFTLVLLLCNQSLLAQTSKLSSYVKQSYLEFLAQERAKSPLVSKSRHAISDPAMTAFVQTSSPELLRQNGCSVLASFDDIHIVSLPLSKIAAIAGLKQVLRIEAGRPCSVTNNDASAITHVDALHSGVPGYTGAGVVVGVMDIGMDLAHPSFWSADGSTYRIKSYWDMLDQTQGGKPVTGVDTTYVGRQYTSQSAILDKGHSADGALSGHGTHTAGTAAGSGRNEDGTLSDYAGMAPEADICLVSNYTSTSRPVVPESDRKKYNTALDALGFKYMFDYAESHGKPCVISFSEGANQEMEGEDLLFNAVLERLQGQGRIIVASAGNEGDKKTYINKGKGTPSAGAFVSPSGTGAYYVMRSDEKMTLRITYYLSSGDKVIKEYHTDQITACKDSVLADTLDISEPSQVILLNAYPYVYDKTKWATELYLTTKGNTETVGKTLPVSVTLLGEDIGVEAFSRGGYFTTNTLDATLNKAEANHCILVPGALSSVICVGGVTKSYTSPQRASWSGVGPTVDGLIKPDVMAPGSSIMSAKSKAYYGSYGWTIMGGTSMSTPVVAGIVALWLQACPTLTHEQVLETIAATSSHPDSSLEYPNNYYGYGLIDAEAGLQYVLENFTGIAPLRLPPSSQAQALHGAGGEAGLFNLLGQRVGTPVRGKIYIVNGKKITCKW